MSYGLSVLNDSTYLQIDSDTPRLCSLFNGSYSASSRLATITFPSPITTPEPPCVFIRNSQDRPDELYDMVIITGSAGNWTGVQIQANNINSRPSGKWFAAVFASRSDTSGYGMRLWGTDGALVYDSGATPIIVTRCSNSWSYVSYTTFPTLGTATNYKCNMSTSPLLSDEYFMINPFSRNMLTPNNINAQNAGARWDYTKNELSIYAVGFRANWIDIGQPGAVLARLPGS